MGPTGAVQGMSSDASKLRVLYAGDNIEKISVSREGYDYVYSDETEGRLAIALNGDPNISVKRMWGDAISKNFPNSVDDLSKFNVIILSDVGSDTLFQSEELARGTRVPNRLKLIREFVQRGGGLVMIGGYSSFGGFLGIARYHGTPVEEALPVSIKDGDDRVEVPEGFSMTFSKTNHPVLSNLDRKEDHYFLGYNRVHAKDGTTVLADYMEDPIAVVGTFGKGRTMAFASDCDLHWGGSFVKSQNYPKFWRQSIKWLSNSK
jgi:uncharacterized membrane protein